MKSLLSTMKATISIAIAFSVSLTSTADPNCPPQYQEICKQLIRTLEDNNDGKHFYTWDGTHLTINGNFALYDSINHSSTDHRTGNVNTTAKELAFGKDYFPHLLNQMVAASQGGQRVYLHLFYGWGLDAYTVAGVSNTPIASPSMMAQPMAVPTPMPQQPIAAPSPAPAAIPNMVPQPMAVPTPMPQQPIAAPSPAPAAIPNIVPQPMAVPTPMPQQPAAAPSPAPSAIPNMVPQPMNQPQTISVTHNVSNANGLVVDKTTVNAHFVTDTAGNHLDQESRAYLFDNNNDVWSCMVAGLGTRQTASENGEIVTMGHAETLEFRSTHIAHIPANHPMHPGCLISVQQ